MADRRDLVCRECGKARPITEYRENQLDNPRPQCNACAEERALQSFAHGMSAMGGRVIYNPAHGSTRDVEDETRQFDGKSKTKGDNHFDAESNQHGQVSLSLDALADADTIHTGWL